MTRLMGRTALITGAATGIGRATALLFAQNGARVVLFGLGGAELEAAAGEVGGRAVHGDVTRDADIALAIAACGPRLDIVVNAAGLIVPDQPLDVTDDVWARTLDVNLTGTMRVCRAALPILRQQGGAIVNVSSVAARKGIPPGSDGSSGPYAVAKAGVMGLTRQLALELGEFGVRVNCVASGVVASGRLTRVMEFTGADRGPEGLLTTIPMGRVGSVAECAALIVALCTDDTSYMTGVTIDLNGASYAA